MKKDLLSIYELELADFEKIWKKAARLKKILKEGKDTCFTQRKNSRDDF